MLFLLSSEPRYLGSVLAIRSEPRDRYAVVLVNVPGVPDDGEWARRPGYPMRAVEYYVDTHGDRYAIVCPD